MGCQGTGYSELLRRSVFTMPPPPDLLRCERFFFERKNVCNSQENGVSAHGALR